MSVAMLLAAAVSALATEATAPPPVITSELNSMAKAVRSFAPTDEFDKPPAQPSVAGRRFEMEVQPWGTKPPRMACFGYPMWSYDSSSSILYVSTGASKLMLSSFSTKQGIVTKKSAPDIWPENVLYFASDCAREDMRSYRATNAYGAEFRIDPTAQIVTAVADNVAEGSALTRSFEMKTSGTEARSLVPNLRVRFRGILADWKTGVSVACGRRHDGPTADSPYDRTLKLCLFNGRIDQIELLDARTGQVLQTAAR
jgi:hypothetical protein